MQSRKIKINAPAGLHARPAGEISKLVKAYADSRVSVSTAVKTVNAASVLSLLSLGLKQGTEIEISVEGGDESAVLAAVSELIENIKE